jgi:hypothetical protein
MNTPYRFHPDNILLSDDIGPLVEIPPTIGFLQKRFGIYGKIRKVVLNSNLRNYHLIGMLDRLRVMNFRWLSPEHSSDADMIKLVKAFIQNRHSCLNMTFHSTSLLPGCGPFVKNKSDLSIFIRRITSFLRFCCNNEMMFSPLSSALNGLLQNE